MVTTFTSADGDTKALRPVARSCPEHSVTLRAAFFLYTSSGTAMFDASAQA